MNIRSVFAFLAVWLGAPCAVLAQTDIVFMQKAICNNDGTINHAKFLNAALKRIDISKAIDSGMQINNEKLFELLADTDTVQTFFEEYVNKRPNKYYNVYRTKAPSAPVDMLDLFRNPSAYTMLCRDYPPAENTGTAIRKELDALAKAAGKNILVGKDLDSLNKPLATREAAKVSVTKDGVSKNTLTQTEFAVAAYASQEIPFKISETEVRYATLSLMPFVTGAGTYNSNDKLDDVDKAMAGIMVDFWSVPIFGLRHGFSSRAGYQIDTSKNYEALNTELVYFPPPGLFGAFELGAKTDVGGSEGMWVIFDLTSRARYGRIYENTSIVTLPKKGEYVRAGYKAEATLGFGGDDLLSSLSFNISYLYFDNLRGGRGISQFERLDASMSFKLTDNYGITFGYKKGRDEDQLKKMDQVTGALTFKFGEKPGTSK